MYLLHRGEQQPTTYNLIMAETKKKTRKEAMRELRMLEKEISGGKSLINYGQVHQRHMDDKRFERELKNKEILQEQADKGASKGSDQAPSATYDAFMRMQTGQETRTIADKINDPNRVSWEQFRKDNADKLDIPGADRKKMVEYRAQLDAEREAALAKGRNRPKRKLGVSSSSESEGEENGGGAGAASDSDGDGHGNANSNGAGSSSRRKKSRKKEKRSKKESGSSSRSKKSKKHKSSKRSKKSKKSSSRRDGDNSDDSSGSDRESDSEDSKRRRRKEKKSKRKQEKEAESKHDPRRLSAFLQGSSESESDAR